MTSALSSQHPRPASEDSSTFKKICTEKPANPERLGIGVLDQEDLLQRVLGFLTLQEIGKHASIVDWRWNRCSKTTIQNPQSLTLETLSICHKLLSEQWQMDFSKVHSILPGEDMSSQQTHVDAFLASAALWAKNSNLRRVFTPELSIEQIQHLFSVLADSPTLTYLYLQGDGAIDECFGSVDPDLDTPFSEHRLSQENIDLPPVSFPALEKLIGWWVPWPILAQLSGRAPNLTSLALFPSSLFNGDAPRLFLYGQLRELTLEEPYTKEPVNDVLEGIVKQCPGITCLDLISQGTENLSDLYAISKFKQLTYLCIKDFPIPTAVLRTILMGCPNLDTLALTGYATDDVDDDTFVLLQEHAKQLRFLTLDFPEYHQTFPLISFEAVQRLFQNPEFEIFYGYIPGFVDACVKFKINPAPFLAENPQEIRLQFEREEIEKIPPPIRRVIDLSVRMERERILIERDLMAFEN